MSVSTTDGILVEVTSHYLEEKSAPFEDYYFFAYHVRISNLSDETAQLLSRRWFITDAEGQSQIEHGGMRPCVTFKEAGSSDHAIGIELPP